MSHDEGLVCPCVAEHRPAPLELNLHHIWPLYLGGPDTAANKTPVCPTTHVNVHELLRVFLSPVGILTFSECSAAWPQPVSRYAYKLAMQGYLCWGRGAL